MQRDYKYHIWPRDLDFTASFQAVESFVLQRKMIWYENKDRHVIMIVEEESSFNPTIQGHDYEQIRFPSNLVEKSFIDLMQEFRSLGISGL